MRRFSSHKRSAARSNLRVRASVPGAGMAVFEAAIVAPEDCCDFRRALPRHRRRADFFLAAERPFSVPFTGMVLCQPVITSQAAPDGTSPRLPQKATTNLHLPVIIAVCGLSRDELPADHPNACKSEPQQSYGGSTVRNTVKITTGREAKHSVRRR